MSAKKWLRMLPFALAAALLLCVLINLLVDPFGVFGDRLLRWDSYDQTNNPRVAKLEYLERHHEEYDSYIIGSSSAASYDTERLNAYTGASFYNLFVYGCNTKDYSDFAAYLIGHYEVKNLILNLGINEAATPTEDGTGLTDRPHYKVNGGSPLAFYLKYALAGPRYSLEKLRSRASDTLLPQIFDVFDVQSGCYDKRVRDVENVGDLAWYEASYGADFSCDDQSTYLGQIDACVQAVEQIRDLCAERGVRLTVIFSPVYSGQWEKVDAQELQRYRQALAAVTDYWDFAQSAVSDDARYFYDATHFRNAVGDMVLAKIFGDDSVWMPEDFGRRIARGTQPEEQTPAQNAHSVTVPILMYHHLAAEGDDATVITPERFRAQLEAVKAAGWHAVSMQELYDYVYHGAELPEKPFCITLDDGYASNYELAYPILKELNLKATIFSIGFSFGCTEYKDTGNAITPHFTFEQAREMTASGLISIQSHTFDMHQWPPFETAADVRATMSPLPGESEADFQAAILADVKAYRTMYEAAFGAAPIALAYPEGVYSTLTEVTLHENGFAITLCTDPARRNTLVKGLPQTLCALGRLNVSEAQTPQDILDYLESKIAK